MSVKGTHTKGTHKKAQNFAQTTFFSHLFLLYILIYNVANICRTVGFLRDGSISNKPQAFLEQSARA